jgi:hypothetical protein
MLDVTGCTCPTGLLWRGVYDATGVQYKVPEWVVVEPEGLAEDDEDDDEAAVGPANADKQIDGVQESIDSNREEIVLVRVRASHNQRDYKIDIRKTEPVASIVEKVKKQAEVRPWSDIILLKHDPLLLRELMPATAFDHPLESALGSLDTFISLCHSLQ